MNIHFVFPTLKNKEDVLAFYNEFRKQGTTCIGYNGSEDYDSWLRMMEDRKNATHLPKGYVRENFYLCYDGDQMVGVFNLKFSLTEYLLNYGGHIGYAVAPSKRNKGYGTLILREGLLLSKKLGFDKVLCVVDDDNIASIKIIEKNGGVYENSLYDEEEKVNVKRYWIDLSRKK